MKVLGPDNPRFDFSVGEDARAITIADVNLELESFSLKHRAAAADQRKLVLIPLPENGGICGRFRFGELDDNEEQNWVARATRSISIPTGQFAIDAGGFFGQQVDSEITESIDYAIAQVPEGDYELTCYVYLCSDIATDLLKKRKLSYVDWYRTTYPDAAIPGWLFELAEERDNDFEEERLEQVSDSEIDFESEDNFLELLFQLKPVDDNQAIVATEISKSGKPKWEKRLTKEFPNPILTTDATAQLGTASLAKLIAKAFSNRDFERASSMFVDSMQVDVVKFLDSHYATISKKMTVPTRILPGESFADAESWIEKAGRTNVLCHPKPIQRSDFVGSRSAQLDNSERYKQINVCFNLGFVKADAGLRAYAIELTWKAPRVPKRRRIEPAADAALCEQCGEKLMTAKAKQCLSCGASWH